MQASDRDNDPLTYSLEKAPNGMTVNANGIVTWQPQPTQLGINPVVAVVSDGRSGTVRQSFDLSVGSMSNPTNTAPTITSIPTFSALSNQTYRYDAKAIDAEGDPLLWDLESSTHQHSPYN